MKAWCRELTGWVRWVRLRVWLAHPGMGTAPRWTAFWRREPVEGTAWRIHQRSGCRAGSGLGMGLPVEGFAQAQSGRGWQTRTTAEPRGERVLWGELPSDSKCPSGRWTVLLDGLL